MFLFVKKNMRNIQYEFKYNRVDNQDNKMQMTLTLPFRVITEIKLLPAVFIIQSTSASKHHMSWVTMQLGPGSLA